jgi:hypothetical protein
LQIVGQIIINTDQRFENGHTGQFGFGQHHFLLLIDTTFGNGLGLFMQSMASLIE